MNWSQILLVFETPTLVLVVLALRSLAGRFQRDHEKLNRIIEHLGLDPQQWLGD